jgi:hypothetical protein
MAYNIDFNVPVQSRHARGYIFVVSHMRSFSTLLCHILGSNSDISGYVETHLSYLGRIDLNRLTAMVRETTGDPAIRKYALDKVLHNYAYIAPSVLSRSNVKILFLVRNAEDTLRSIVNLFLGEHRSGPISNPEQALDYYAARLQRIEEYSAQLGRNAKFLQAEKLLDDTDTVLDSLSQWLELDEKLSANYRTFKFTGVDHYGDPSPNIKAGQIVTDAEVRHRTYVPVPIPETVLRRGNEIYVACRQTLLRNQGAL